MVDPSELVGAWCGGLGTQNIAVTNVHPIFGIKLPFSCSLFEMSTSATISFGIADMFAMKI